MQIPYLDGFLLKYILGVVTVVCALANLFPIFSVIFTGGVGKNGSTVAVSPLTRIFYWTCRNGSSMAWGAALRLLLYCKIFTDLTRILLPYFLLTLHSHISPCFFLHPVIFIMNCICHYMIDNCIHLIFKFASLKFSMSY